MNEWIWKTFCCSELVLSEQIKLSSSSFQKYSNPSCFCKSTGSWEKLAKFFTFSQQMWTSNGEKFFENLHQKWLLPQEMKKKRVFVWQWFKNYRADCDPCRVDTDGVNAHELGVMTHRGASPKAPVLAVPMATVVNLRPTHTHTHSNSYMRTKIIHTRPAWKAHSSPRQLAASQSRSQEMNCGVNLCKRYNLPWDNVDCSYSNSMWVIYGWWRYCRGLSSKPTCTQKTGSLQVETDQPQHVFSLV